MSCQDIVLSWQETDSLSDDNAPATTGSIEFCLKCVLPLLNENAATVQSILETPDDIDTRLQIFEQQWEKHVNEFVASFFQDRKSN